MGKNISAEDYVHLHNHTHYSLLDGLTKIPDLINFIKDCKMQAVAITDHGTMSGAIEMYSVATANGIKPIIGIETYVASRKHIDKDPSKDKQRFHLILLATNSLGYQNLMRLSTIANLEGYYYYPRVDHELLQQYNEGLIALSGCMGGELGDLLKQNQYSKAIELAKWYKNIFKDRYYLEVQDHGHPDNELYSKEQNKINDQIIKIGNELNIPVVVTCDAHYLKHADQNAHEVLLCVGTGSFLSDENRMSLKDFPLHVTKPEEIIKRWGPEHPDFILNTKKIADRCDVKLDLGNILIPKFSVPKGQTEKSLLESMVFSGLLWRYNNILKNKAYTYRPNQAKKILPKEVLDRASYELSVIEKMGFEGYYLIVADFVNWGKNQGIVFGPGRGSAAGSIIAYALNITQIDPLKYDLLFERFLNPDRISMPDIDIDIQDTRRDEVIQYCVKKYGKERVANIVTFGTMAARNAVRDTARVLEVPYADADRLAKMIPPPVQGRHIPLKLSIKDNADLKREYENNIVAKKIFDLAMQLEGTIRSHGVHAAGVVIAPDDIVKFVPLEKAQKGVIATQYSMGPIEDIGLLKMDFLGLSNLTIIKNTLRIIKKVYKKEMNIDELPLSDEKTFKLFQSGDTTGVFQFESSGMKRYLKELKPTVFEDIIAMGALYRPGPLTAGLTDKFIARKNGKEKVNFDHELMEPALKDTYGVMVYQEQFMQIVRDMCGFSGGESDTLRKAVGKKKRDMMAKLKDKVIEGGVKNNVDKKIVEKFWNDLEGFADYAFNKSHAACYALIAYQTAYLKAHYPSAFMAALMTSDYDDTDRLAIEITECRHIGIEVLQPDINESFLEFAIVPNKKQIRFGLNAIKNVGSGAVEEIIKSRDSDGKFATIEEFFSRISTKLVNRKTVESLIKSGAFDNLEDRLKLLDNIDVLMAYASKCQKDASSGQTDLFGNGFDEIKKPNLILTEQSNNYTLKDELAWERELLGLYLSQHPLDSYKNLLEEKTIALSQIQKEHHKKAVTIGGLVNIFKEITTKNGQKMAFVQITDGENEIEVIVFPSIYQQTVGIWNKDHVVIIKGKVSSQNQNGDDDDIKIIADDAREVTLAQAESYQQTGKKAKVPKITKVNHKSKNKKLNYQKIYIRIKDSENTTLLLIKDIIKNNKGDSQILLVLGDDNNKQVIKLPENILINEEVIAKIEAIVGKENVAIK
jgi:DNA polymerase-3 subunit alpha